MVLSNCKLYLLMIFLFLHYSNKISFKRPPKKPSHLQLPCVYHAKGSLSNQPWIPTYIFIILGKTFLVETAGPKKDGNTVRISLPKERRGFWDGHNINVEGHGFNKGESNELCIGNVCNSRRQADINAIGHGENTGESNELCIGNVCNGRGVVTWL